MWRKQPDANPIIVRDEMISGCSVRLRLLRELAVRARPYLAKISQRWTATPKNGDYLDARRLNLQVAIRPAPRGRPTKTAYRPKGYLKTKGDSHV